MSTLNINLNLLDYSDEHFSIERNNAISDDIFALFDLSASDKVVYQNFINLIGFNCVILTDVTLTDDNVVFNRIRLFEHDEKFKILNAGSYLKSYNEYSAEDKQVIDLFITLLEKF